MVRGPTKNVMPDLVFGQGNYVDRGCDLAPSCLACPFPKCRYDMGDTAWTARRMLNVARNAEIVRALDSGEHAESIALRLGISSRSVYRLVHGS